MITRLLSQATLQEGLFNSLKRGVAKEKRGEAKIRKYMRKPDKYKLVKKMVPFDWKQKELVFPVSIRLRMKHIYAPKKNVMGPPPVEDYLNFKIMTGNEILLNLMNVEHFRNNELVEGLKYLSWVKGADAVDWNAHEVFAKVVLHTNKVLHQLEASQFASVVRLFTTLKVRDEKFWELVYARTRQIESGLKGRGLRTRLQRSDERSEDAHRHHREAYFCAA